MEAKSDDDSSPPDSAIIQWHEACNKGFSLAGCNVASRPRISRINERSRVCEYSDAGDEVADEPME